MSEMEYRQLRIAREDEMWFVFDAVTDVVVGVFLRLHEAEQFVILDTTEATP